MVTVGKVSMRHRLLRAYRNAFDHPAKLRIYDWLRQMPIFRFPTARFEYGTFRLDILEFVQNNMFLSGSWEPSTFRLFRDLVPVGGNVVDVGAHVGQFTIAAAAKVGPGGMVIGIEPNPSTCAILLSNVEQSQQTKVVRVVSTPLSTGAEIISFGTPPVWSTGLTRPRKDTTEAGFFVRAITPSDLLQYFGMNNVDVMKIDIEAHDLDVISSLFETSTIRPHHILFEYIPDHFSYHISQEEISNYFAHHGYKLFLVNGDPYLPTIRAIEDNLWACRTL